MGRQADTRPAARVTRDLVDVVEDPVRLLIRRNRWVPSRLDQPPHNVGTMALPRIERRVYSLEPRGTAGLNQACTSTPAPTIAALIAAT